RRESGTTRSRRRWARPTTARSRRFQLEEAGAHRPFLALGGALLDLPDLRRSQGTPVGLVLRQQLDRHVVQREMNGLGFIDTQAFCEAPRGVAGDAGHAVGWAVAEGDLVGGAAGGHE